MNSLKLETSPWLHERSWSDIETYLQSNDIILIPVGATEQHGRHLPLNVDTQWSVALAEGAAKEAGVLATPPVHFGWSPHHLAFPGSVTLSAETLTNVLVDVGQSLVYHGFKKLLFINGNRLANHAPMEIAASKLRFKTGAYASIIDVGLIARREISQIFPDGEAGHAADVETSFMLHWQPELVDMSKAAKGKHVKPGPIAKHPMMLQPPFDLNAVTVRATDAELRTPDNPTGIDGDATVATAEKGKQALDAIIKNTVLYIDEVRPIQVNLKPVSIPV